MRVLDLFCGLGGWGKGFHAEEFDVLGIDVVNVGYPFPLILQDVKTLDGSRFEGFDVIVGSPPCRDFTRMCDHAVRSDGTVWRWKDPKNPERGLGLVRAFLRVVNEAQPQIWLMENVSGLREHLDLKPRFQAKLARNMTRCFWGDFPDFTVPFDSSRPRAIDIQGKKRAWKRAEIPLCVSQAFATACKHYLEAE